MILGRYNLVPVWIHLFLYMDSSNAIGRGGVSGSVLNSEVYSQF